MDRHAFVKRLWAALRAHDLTPYAYLVGRSLLRHANKQGQCWPSHATIAEELGCSDRTVGRAVGQLRDLGLIAWQQRKGTLHKRSSNLYALLTPSLSKLRKLFESSPATMSEGLQAALRRLEKAIGCQAGHAMPWLAAGLVPATPPAPRPDHGPHCAEGS